MIRVKAPLTISAAMSDLFDPTQGWRSVTSPRSQDETHDPSRVSGRAIMAFKTILTITGLDQGARDLKLASGLCEQVDAHLAVLVLALAAPPPAGVYAAMVSDPWLQERQHDLQQLKARAAEVSGLLSGSALSADVSGEYPEIAGAH